MISFLEDIKFFDRIKINSNYLYILINNLSLENTNIPNKIILWNLY